MASHQQEEALEGVGDGGGGQVQADQNDDGAGDHRGQEAHDLLHAHQLDDGGQYHIEQTGHHNAAAGVLQLDSRVHTGVFAHIQLGHRLKAAQVGKGGAQEGGNLQLGADMEEEGTNTGEKQGGLDGQGQAVALNQDGDQHGCAEHGEHMLQAQDEHLGQTQGACIPDGLTAGGTVVVHSTFLSFHAGRKKATAFSKKKQSLITTVSAPKTKPILFS